MGDVIVAAKVAVSETEPAVVTEPSKEDKEILIGSEEFYKIKRAHMEKLHKDLCKIGWGDKLKYVTKKFDKKDPYAFGERWVGKNERGNCFLAALARNLSRINSKKGKAELKRICFRGKCPECESELSATVQDLLEQEDYGCDYEMGSEGGALKCTNCCVECRGYSKAKMKKCKHDPDGFQGWYVTGMCHGEFGMDCGKFVNIAQSAQVLVIVLTISATALSVESIVMAVAEDGTTSMKLKENTFLITPTEDQTDIELAE